VLLYIVTLFRGSVETQMV